MPSEQPQRTDRGVGLLGHGGGLWPAPHRWVHKPGPIPAEERQGGDIQVLPPGPRDDALPVEIVRGFFGAQSSPSDAHAIAREFLSPELQKTWRDNGPVSVLGSSLHVEVAGPADTFRVTASMIGQISTDGSYDPARGNVDIRVELRRGLHGRWQITNVPDGLVLSPTDRDRSFRARNIYYLARHRRRVPVVPSGPRSGLPARAGSLVGRARAAAARWALPPARRLGVDGLPSRNRRPVGPDGPQRAGDGLPDGQLSRAPARLREEMSAQLVWTLRGTTEFSQLLLLSSGKPVDAGSGGVSRSFESRATGGLCPRRPGLERAALLHRRPTAAFARGPGRSGLNASRQQVTTPLPVLAAAPWR